MIALEAVSLLFCFKLLLSTQFFKVMGTRIAAVREALSYFICSLPASCKFNIYGFGSTFKSLFESSVPVDDKSVSEALEHSKSLEADMGGTNLHPPLQHIFSQNYDDEFPLQTIVLTDGGSNLKPPLNLFCTKSYFFEKFQRHKTQLTSSRSTLQRRECLHLE